MGLFSYLKTLNFLKNDFNIRADLFKRNFYIRYHPRIIQPSPIHPCKKLKYKPRQTKKPLSEEKKAAADLITHLIGALKNENYPSVRLLLCFEQHAMLASEKFYYSTLFKSFGLRMYKIRSSMVDYVFRRHHLFVRSLQPLFYCDSLIAASFINDLQDPLKILIPLLSELDGPQPRMFFVDHHVPIENRFILTGGRVDFNVYTATHLRQLSNLPPRKNLLGDISFTLNSLPALTASHILYPATSLTQNLTYLTSDNSKVVDS